MNLVHRYLRVYITWKNHEKVFLSWDKQPYNGAFEFTSPFSIGISPDMNQLTAYNLNDEEFALFMQGRTITITAGFYDSDYTEKNGGIITKGTIKSSTPLAQDGVDRTVQVNFNHFPDISEDTIKVKKVTKVKVSSTRKKASGKSATAKIEAYNKKKTSELNSWLKNNPNATAHDRGVKRKSIASQRKTYAAKTRKAYSQVSKAKKEKAKYVKQVKYANLSFKKGTKSSTMIKTIAKKANIPLGAVKLNYDHKYPNSYTVSGKPLNAIKKIADAANTPCFIEGSKLFIREITTGEKATLKLTPETGLISHPTPSDDGEYDGKKYEAQSLMLKELHVGAIIYVDDGIKNLGKCVVLGGQREYTTSTSTVTFQFVPYSAFQKARADSLKKAKANVAKEKKKEALKQKNKKAKDDAAKGKVKSKRAKRSKKK